MADYYFCRNCEVRLTLLPEDRTVIDLGPCSNCGVSDWAGVVELAGTVAASSSVSASLTVTPRFPQGQVIQAQPVERGGRAVPPEVEQGPPVEPTIAPAELPTEFIAETLSLDVNILRPVAGKWPIDIEGFGVIGFATVGSREDAVLAAAEYIDGLIERWEERLRAKDPDRRNPDEPAS